jgi:hypothetical protein
LRLIRIFLKVQNLAQLLDSEEVLFCLAGSHRQALMESGLSSRQGRELAAAREIIEALKRREAELGDEISAVYGAYDKTMAELRRCREGVRDFEIKVMIFRIIPLQDCRRRSLFEGASLSVDFAGARSEAAEMPENNINASKSGICFSCQGNVCMAPKRYET